MPSAHLHRSLMAETEKLTASSRPAAAIQSNGGGAGGNGLTTSSGIIITTNHGSSSNNHSRSGSQRGSLGGHSGVGHPLLEARASYESANSKTSNQATSKRSPLLSVGSDGVGSAGGGSSRRASSIGDPPNVEDDDEDDDAVAVDDAERNDEKLASSKIHQQPSSRRSSPPENGNHNNVHRLESGGLQAKPSVRLSRQAASLKRSQRGAPRAKLFSQTSSSGSSRHRGGSSSVGSDVEKLLTYTKCFLIAAYFVFICGSGITLNELFEFLIDDYQDSRLITGVILLILGAVSLIGLWGAFKEDSCILMIYGGVILIVFFLHVILLFLLKNACTETQKKCYRNMATPPGLAPILVAISELAIAMCAFFMALVIESERKKRGHSRHEEDEEMAYEDELRSI